MESNKFRFTKTALSAVKCPSGKNRIRVHDTEVPGLTLKVTSGGSRVYYLYRFVAGKARMKLPSWLGRRRPVKVP